MCIDDTDEISGLLMFARQQPIDPTTVDPIDSLTRMAPLLYRLIGEDISLTWNTDADVWPIKIDPSQFDQILTNLVVNARDAIITDATDGGMINVGISNTVLDQTNRSSAPNAQPGDYVRVTVADNGPDLDDLARTKIFEPYFSTKGAGHGLGLSTVYGIVEQNNGFVTTASPPGHGATFEVFLPRHHGPVDAHVELPAPHAVHRGLETILIAEDEPAILELMATILVAEGYAVLTASNATDALRLAREHPTPIDLLVTDLVMPDISGRELVTRLTLAGIHTRHLFMSGYPANLDTLGDTTAYLQKPFTLGALTTKIREILDTESQPAPK